MTVIELITELQKYPKDMLVITRLMSDYCSVDDPEILNVIHNASNDYFERYYEN